MRLQSGPERSPHTGCAADEVCGDNISRRSFSYLGGLLLVRRLRDVGVGSICPGSSDGRPGQSWPLNSPLTRAQERHGESCWARGRRRAARRWAGVGVNRFGLAGASRAGIQERSAHCGARNIAGGISVRAKKRACGLEASRSPPLTHLVLPRLAGVAPVVHARRPSMATIQNRPFSKDYRCVGVHPPLQRSHTHWHLHTRQCLPTPQRSHQPVRGRGSDISHNHQRT